MKALNHNIDGVIKKIKTIFLERLIEELFLTAYQFSKHFFGQTYTKQEPKFQVDVPMLQVQSSPCFGLHVACCGTLKDLPFNAYFFYYFDVKSYSYRPVR
jgi:hypothetical protein